MGTKKGLTKKERQEKEKKERHDYKEMKARARMEKEYWEKLKADAAQEVADADRATSVVGFKSSQSEQCTPRSCGPGETDPKFGPAARRMMMVTNCAANARGPTPETKSRKFVYLKHTDKEDLLDELVMLKAAVADQTYHFQLHKVHLFNLRDQHSELEQRVVALEGLEGNIAPRTGGESRLTAKIAGLQTRMQSLETGLQIQRVNLAKLKKKYQVCATREATMEREIFAGEVLRLQRAKNHSERLLSELLKHNHRFLLLRDRIIPKLQESINENKEFIKSAETRIKENEAGIQSYKEQQEEKVDTTEKRVKMIKQHEDKGKKLRAQLKQEREKKRKMLQELWSLDYETGFIERENRFNEKVHKAKEERHQREKEDTKTQKD